MKPIRTQSTDPVIRAAARSGVKLFRWCGSYWTASAKECAREARVSESFMRRVARIHVARMVFDVSAESENLVNEAENSAP